MKTIITTESCSDIPASMLEKLNVPMVPFSVNFPDRTVLDGELPIQEIYDFYESTRQIPKTCAVSPYQYSEFFNRLLEDPEVEIVHIGYSSACSCSFQNALISLQDCDESRIHLVDCLNVSGGFGLLTLKAVELHTRNPQWSAAELAEEVRKWVPRIKTLFIPEKLDFLAAGGRVSNAAALGASLLRIKPRIDILKGADQHEEVLRYDEKSGVPDGGGFPQRRTAGPHDGADHLCQRRRPGFVGTAASARAERRFPGSAGV